MERRDDKLPKYIPSTSTCMSSSKERRCKLPLAGRQSFFFFFFFAGPGPPAGAEHACMQRQCTPINTRFAHKVAATRPRATAATKIPRARATASCLDPIPWQHASAFNSGLHWDEGPLLVVPACRECTAVQLLAPICY
ncbi:hypothetical protein U9M48_041124 [Paspalum notatum var. saurae]|uniref:Uncharacterized protein n=1 Tax=Paspalum notatum var. saurae TaxID=547442 RepID=A0AAQ3UMI8_PASNO